MTTNEEHRASSEAERNTVTVSADGKQAEVSIAGASGHHSPGERTAVASEALDDERLARTDHVVVSVPRGDMEVLEQVRSRLEPNETRQAGATILIEGRHLDSTPVEPVVDSGDNPVDDGSTPSAPESENPAG